MNKILALRSREIFDSRGTPTLEVDVILEGNIKGRAAVPSGASTGKFEALELRDKEPRLMGKGVLKALNNIQTHIAPHLVGKKFNDQSELDQTLLRLDGTKDKSHLGANAILGVSLAFARAQAAFHQLPLYRWLGTLSGCSSFSLPVPLVNVLNGGVHADNPLSPQEFMLVPYGFSCFREALGGAVEIFHALKGLLKKKALSTNVGDEGGFAPSLASSRQALDFLMESIHLAGYTVGKHVGLALDVAASELYEEQSQRYRFPEENLELTAEQLVRFYEQLAADYPLLSIEDGMAENDHEGWHLLTQVLGESLQLVGDDLFVTNPSLFAQGIKDHLANAILVKVNQIGTLTEALQAISMAQAANYQAIISHRSGETEDTFIADLVVGSGSRQIKTGSVARSDRVAKYNQLLRIEEEIGEDAHFAGKEAFNPSVIARIDR